MASNDNLRYIGQVEVLPLKVGPIHLSLVVLLFIQPIGRNIPQSLILNQPPLPSYDEAELGALDMYTEIGPWW